VSERRRRPVDGGIEWAPRMNAFFCRGCCDWITVRRGVWNNPEALFSKREEIVADHAECWEYSDAREARLVRRFRKEIKRRMRLAAQRVSWRGRL